jgi:hypothetical protein
MQPSVIIAVVRERRCTVAVPIDDNRRLRLYTQRAHRYYNMLAIEFSVVVVVRMPTNSGSLT